MLLLINSRVLWIMKTLTFGFIAIICLFSIESFGQAWSHRPIFPQSSNLKSIIAFEDGLAVTVGESGVIERSIDTGKTWSVQTEANYTFNSIASNDGKDFVAVASEGVSLESDDSGVTWVITTIPGSPSLNSIMAIGPTNFIAVGNNGVIESSTNAGSSWSSHTSGITTNLNSIVAFDHNHYIVSGDSGTIMFSSNGGMSWSPATSGVTSSLRHLTLAPDGRVFAYGDNWCNVESLDTGRTWNQNSIDNSTAIQYPAARVESIVFFSSVHGFAFVAQDPYALLNDYVTDDGGNTWTVVQSIIDQNDDNASAIAIDTLRALKVGQTGGIYYTSNQGNAWIQRAFPSSNNYRSILFTTTDNGYVITGQRENQVYRTTNGGLDWKKVASTPSAGLATGMVFPSSAVGYLYGESFFMQTTDSGSSWNNQTTSVGNVISASFISPAYGVMLNSTPSIEVTTDSGSSWSTIPIPVHSQNVVSAIHLFGTDTLIVLGLNNIYFSTDRGSEWDSISLPYVGSSMTFLPSGEGWIVGDPEVYDSKLYSVIFNSTAPDNAWGAQYLDSSFNYTGVTTPVVSAYDNSDAIAILFSGIFETHDGGMIWKNDSSIGMAANDIPVSVSYPSGSTLYLLSGLGVLFKESFSVSSVSTTNQIQPSILYPDPVGSILHILNAAGTISIVDPIGRSYSVSTIRERSPSLGREVTLDVSSLSPGVYFVVSGAVSAKFVKE